MRSNLHETETGARDTHAFPARRDQRPRTVTPPGEAPAAVSPPSFPDWVTETYRALERIEYLHSAQQLTHQNAPNTSQIKNPEITERKCRR